MRLKVLSLDNQKKYSDFQEFTTQDFVIDTDNPNNIYVAGKYLPWAKEHYGEWLKNFQQDSLIKYICRDQSEDSGVFNAFMKYAGSGNLNMKEEELNIISATMKSPIAVIPTNIVVYRAAQARQFYQRIRKKKIHKNEIILIPGLLSTGLIRDTLLDSDEYKYCDMVFKIYVPAGTRGIYLDFISHRFFEQEMLLDRDQSIKILSIKKKKGVTYVTACIV